MPIVCDEKCGKCKEETCISYQVNTRLLESIKKTNHGGNDELQTR